MSGRTVRLCCLCARLGVTSAPTSSWGSLLALTAKPIERQLMTLHGKPRRRQVGEVARAPIHVEHSRTGMGPGRGLGRTHRLASGSPSQGHLTWASALSKRSLPMAKAACSFTAAALASARLAGLPAWITPTMPIILCGWQA